MRLFFIAVLLSLFLTGCAFHRGPDDPVQLTSVSESTGLSGVFVNHGNPLGKLSYTFFGDSPRIDKSSDGKMRHDEIDFVKISVIDQGLLVEAIKGQCIVANKVLRENIDFVVEGGRVVIKTETHFLTRGVGDITVGPSTSKTSLGIDVEGHLIWKRQDYAAVLVGFIIPAAISDVVEVRYEKADIDENTIFQKCVSSE